MTIARKQHHVWKSYLEAWATNKLIYCLQEGRVFRPNLTGVAAQRDFHKLQPLNPSDIRAIKILIGASPPSSRRVHENFIQMLSTAANMKADTPSYMIGDKDFENFLDEQIINCEEQFQGRIETAAKPILDAIKLRDLSFYFNDKQCMRFLHYMCLQYFRTRAIKERVLDRVIDTAIFDVGKCWNVLRHIFAANVGATLFLERKNRKLLLLENVTEIPFITGDQPIINLCCKATIAEAPDLLVLYYPLTPQLALILEECDMECGFDLKVSANDVTKLNRAILSASFLQVFGNTECALTSLIS